MHCGDRAANPVVEGVVGCELLGCRLVRRVNNLREFGMLREAVCQPNAVAQALSVEWIAEVVVVERGLGVGVGGYDTHFACGKGEVDADGHEEQALFRVEAHDLYHVVAEV